MKINIDKVEKDIEIILKYNKENKDMNIKDKIDDYNKLKNELINLKNEIEILKNEVDNLKIFKRNSKNKIKDFNYIENNLDFENNSNIINIKFLNNIVNNSFANTALDNTFSVFNSINNIIYLIYSNKNKSITSYDLINNKILNEIKNAHNEYITNFRHYLDSINKRDLIISISLKNNNIKLWNINNYDCLLNIQNVNKEGTIDSACFLDDNNNNIYILSSNSNSKSNSEPIKIFDLKGNKIKEVNGSNDTTYFIDTYYDIKLNKIYIITGNKGYIKSYDYYNNKLYYKYYDNESKQGHPSIIISNTEKNTNLIESSWEGNIMIWNFHSSELLNKIKVTSDRLYGICLWNKNYLFVGSGDKTIKLIDLTKGIIVENLISHNKSVITIKKIFHPKFGECLISEGWGKNDNIKLWIKKN